MPPGFDEDCSYENLRLKENSQVMLGIELDDGAAKIFEECVKQAEKALRVKTNDLNNLDSSAGDGDCGSVIAEGASGLHQLLKGLYHKEDNHLIIFCVFSRGRISQKYK